MSILALFDAWYYTQTKMSEWGDFISIRLHLNESVPFIVMHRKLQSMSFDKNFYQYLS